MRFLYEATMGLRMPGMQGCILADEMVRLAASWLFAAHPATLVCCRVVAAVGLEQFDLTNPSPFDGVLTCILSSAPCRACMQGLGKTLQVSVRQVLPPPWSSASMFAAAMQCWRLCPCLGA